LKSRGGTDIGMNDHGKHKGLGGGPGLRIGGKKKREGGVKKAGGKKPPAEGRTTKQRETIERLPGKVGGRGWTHRTGAGPRQTVGGNIKLTESRVCESFRWAKEGKGSRESN